MRRISRIVLFLSLVVFSSECGFAQDAEKAVAAPKKPTNRLCLQEDLEGHAYKRVDFKQTPPRGEANIAKMFPHEYLAFQLYNSFTNFMANRLPKSSKDLSQRLQPKANRPQRYTLSQDGVLNFIRDDRILMSYRCVAVLKPINVYLPGDLVLTGYTRKGKSEIYKVYRRLR